MGHYKANLPDTVDNILHLVVARPAGGGPGTKGLSLFVVPKHLVDWDTFEITERNGVFATGLEHKMGYKTSPTCELTFGAHGVPAKGWLVGDRHDGIAKMFKVIENARMLAGIKAHFFAGNVLPEITATRGVLARTSTASMDLDEAAF